MLSLRTLGPALLVVTALGCGGGNPSVSGTVEMQDGTPLKSGRITLTSDSSTYYGDVADGSFSIKGGAAPGEYKVTIEATSAEGGHAAGGGEKGPKIAEKYADSAKTDLTLTVSDEGANEKFTLEPGK